MNFADQLRQLPSVAHLAQLQLLDAAGVVVGSIDNAPGKTGSLTVYAALAAKHGSITVAAAQEGLHLFAEHTATAQAHPGNHPNIDRLFEVISANRGLQVRLVPA